MGDPAGVGPELCVRALSAPECRDRCDLWVFGQHDILARAAEAIHVPLPADLHLHDADMGVLPHGSGVVNCPVEGVTQALPGKVSEACGRAGYKYIETAIQYAMAGRVEAVATAPIHKEALRLSGVQFPGHTEIFTALTGARRTCMMLRSEALTVSMVTTHIGYAEVPQRIGSNRILDVIELTAEALQGVTGRTPKLAMCGLNPHAGEHGLFGQQEEERFIQPALEQARGRGIDIEGPLPPDTAFTTGNRKRYDGVICLYHDQGHIPFKMLAFEDGVNITLGLPIVRTSVDHGTAFDIAWKGAANPTSLYKAVESAVLLGMARKASKGTA